MRVIVPTCDKYLWALRPFAYLFNIFWSEGQPVLVGGFSKPNFELPPNFEFRSIDTQNYPAQRWSDGLIRLLNSINDEVFCFLLEDYWLCRTVPCGHIESLGEFMRMNPDILRIDLTNDRLHSGQGVDIGYWGSTDLFKTVSGTPYQLSLQAALFNRKNLLRCLEPGLGPWDVELRGSELIPEGFSVLGTRNYLVRYVNAVGMQLDEKFHYRTEHIRDGAGGQTIERIPQEHLGIMLERGILPPREK